MKNRKQIYGNFLKIIGILFIFLALCIVIYNLMEDYLAGIKSEEILDKIDELLPTENDNQKVEIPTAEIDNNNYMGILTIESIGIRLPVLAEWDFNKLKIAPARYNGSAYLSNFIIAAHSYKSHFGNIGKLKNGDKVKFEDLNGNTFEDEVIQKEIIEKKDTKKMKEGNWDLTLFTCDTTNNKYRTTIRLRKIAIY